MRNQTSLRSAVQAFRIAFHTRVKRSIDKYLDESLLTHTFASCFPVFRIR